MPVRKAARAWRTASTNYASACPAARPSPIGSTATRRAALCSGRHRKALAKLGLLFKQGKISKTYWALVAGGPAAEEGEIDAAMAKLDVERGWWMKVDPSGQPAQTLWKVRGRGTFEGVAVSWLELNPLTGRTHQLRVHCAHMGWPILGDPVYGDRSAARHSLAVVGAIRSCAALRRARADRSRRAGAGAYGGGVAVLRHRRQFDSPRGMHLTLPSPRHGATGAVACFSGLRSGKRWPRSRLGDPASLCRHLHGGRWR